MDDSLKSIHRTACLNEESGYIDPQTGLFVLTSFFLAQKENCCGSGCRHCPYPLVEQRAAGREDVPAFPFFNSEASQNHDDK